MDIALNESLRSTMTCKVGACALIKKNIITGHNYIQDHGTASMHAEMVVFEKVLRYYNRLSDFRFILKNNLNLRWVRKKQYCSLCR